MRHLIPVLCAAVLATSSALAQAPSAAPIPLPPWFHEIDNQKTGEVSRADFLKYRMESFEELDSDKDGKLTLEEFVKVAEPPFTPDAPGGPTLEERRQHAREEFADLDTNRNGILERAEAEVIVHAEFNQYDLDRDNKVTEAEVRRAQRDLLDRQQVDQRRRDGATVNDYLDSRLREFDMLDTDRDGMVSQQEYLVLAGPPDGPATKDLLPFEMRRALVLRKFQELDANKDRLLDRRELSLHAVREFMEMDSNKDRYLSEAEFKKAQEAEAARMFAAVQKAPAAAASPGVAPASPPPASTPAARRRKLRRRRQGPAVGRRRRRRKGAARPGRRAGSARAIPPRSGDLWRPGVEAVRSREIGRPAPRGGRVWLCPGDAAPRRRLCRGQRRPEERL